ncbi:unnamed protein product [Meloidogyne enterolobii]|uniref:Uncharacterized protein n=1 Tax=Meloidogyne enterolobii TaxID=390850 RepID=A0ACB1AUC8_MELEN
MGRCTSKYQKDQKKQTRKIDEQLRKEVDVFREKKKILSFFHAFLSFNSLNLYFLDFSELKD